MSDNVINKPSWRSQPEHLITSGVVFIVFVALIGMIIGSSWVIGATIGSMHIGPRDSEDRSVCSDLLDKAMLRPQPSSPSSLSFRPLTAGRTITTQGRNYRLESHESGGVRCLALSSPSGFSMLRLPSGAETVSTTK
jgi:zona occludens toxin (predicted ATPase)